MAKAQISHQKLLKGAQGGDILSLSRLLSLVESDLISSLGFLAKQKLPAKWNPVRIGITGPPGAGKSSLVNLLIAEYRKQGHKVGVLAVDPSSPFSGGALLGDRVRMNAHAADPDVFIRSIGSRGGLGGLSAATGAMARVFELCGKDIVIIETVGVGQTELEVMNLAYATAVVLVPESGDVIQTLKAGILEIADCFIVNKCDRPGAEILAHELKALVEQEEPNREGREIYLTSTTDPKNPLAKPISELAPHLLGLALELKSDPVRKALRAHGELRQLLLSKAVHVVDQKIRGKKIKDPYLEFSKFKKLF